MLMYPFIMLFLCVLFLRTLVGLSSSHWLIVWMALELNMLSFIPIMSSSSWFQETEGCIKYFIFQAIGSGVLLLGAVGDFFSFFILVGLLIKLGVAPFHFWFPSVLSRCSWFVCGLLITWQKLIPILLIIYVYRGLYGDFFVFVGVLSRVVGGIGGLNQTQFRPLLGYSSIGHMGWILVSIRVSSGVRFIYFFIYILISVCLMWLFFYSGDYSFSSKASIFQFSFFTFFLFLGLFLSLGGVPPFTGFFPKWLVLLGLGSPSLVVFLLFGSLINLYYYLNICFSIFLCRDLVFRVGLSYGFPFLLLFLCFIGVFGFPLIWYALILFY